MSAIGGFIGSIAMAVGVISSAILAETDPKAALTAQMICYIFAGLGIATMVPSFFSAGGNVNGLSTAQALSRMSLANALFVMFSKALMGFLAEGVGLVVAMVFPLVTFLAAGVIATYVSINSKRIREESLAAYPPTGPITSIDVDQTRG
jgi:pheromone shutdown protein TraB